MAFLIIYLSIINLYGFILMYKDKKYAKKKHWRIPESKLLWVAVLFGSIGVFFGMKAFRHKTKHLKFTITVPLLIIIQLFAMYYLVSYLYL